MGRAQSQILKAEKHILGKGDANIEAGRKEQKKKSAEQTRNRGQGPGHEMHRGTKRILGLYSALVPEPQGGKSPGGRHELCPHQEKGRKKKD